MVRDYSVTLFRSLGRPCGRIIFTLVNILGVEVIDCLYSNKTKNYSKYCISACLKNDKNALLYITVARYVLQTK